MYLSHLALANFRNYRQLDLQLPSPVVLFQGDNGQGKTNLLEAVYFLATTRSLRAGTDRELIDFAALEEPIPFARVEGRVRKSRGELHVEIVIRGDRPERQYTHATPEGAAPQVELSKRVKVNGIARRALDLIGQINVVTFSPQDLDLVAGSPSGRRRYLDIVGCQVDHRYCRTLSQYNRILAQRNHLLKQIRDRQQPPEMLDYWSEELVKSGSYLLYRRRVTVEAMNARIDGYFHRLTATGKTLKVTYHSSVEDALSGGVREGKEGREGNALTPPLSQGERETFASDSPQHSAPSTQNSSEEAGVEQQAEMFREALVRYRRREMLHGASLVGPHRDDLSFRADGIDMNTYGSRGEQRAVALALKLSEVEFMRDATGELPILLLDDVMSELDPSRRALLIAAIDPSGQTLITATDLESFSAEFLSRATLFRVASGTVTPLAPPQGSGT